MRRTGAFGLAAVLAWAAGCGRPEPEETPMTMAAARAGAPPIDGEAPSKLETATFALG